MGLAAFNFERAKLSGRVALTDLDLETTILEIPSRFTADSTNVGRVMFRARLPAGQTRGSAIVRLYNDAEDGQIVRVAAIAVSSACIFPITGGVTMPTIGGMRVTAELTAGSAACNIDAMVDPSTGAIPGSNPFSVVAAVPDGGSAEFGPAPMDCTRVSVQMSTNMVGNAAFQWLDSTGAVALSSAVAGGQEGPFFNFIPAGGYHLSITNTSGTGPKNCMVSWS